ncbi:HD domain-containing phosphohydrolase [Marinobacter alexandrii]|uniref:HD domain-containing phosphohydrolase n=1 Tax=Marinobacter alexandrii TaxID=2570351 RepID=UPI003297D44D
MKILVVDDEPLIGIEMSEYLSLHDYQCTHCCSCEEALKRLQNDGDINLVVTDLRMPGQNGFQLIEAARALTKYGDRLIEFIVITGHGGTEEAVTALRSGACEFLSKPLKQSELLKSVRKAQIKLTRHGHEVVLKKNMQRKAVSDRKEIQSLLGNLDTAYAELTYCLATASEHKDPETGQHIFRIGEYAAFAARLLGWAERDTEMIRLAAPLHDVGKIGTPDSVLLKPGKLTELELRVMRQHPVIGYNILSCATSPVLKMAANISLNHHERWDGSGYPNGLAGNKIPMEAMITSLADVYDALRSDRPYKAALDHRTVCEIVLSGDDHTKPVHFSPHILQLFEANHESFNDIYESMRDKLSNVR